MVICARTLARQCQSLIALDTVPDPRRRDSDVRVRMVHRAVAFAHSLRSQLRACTTMPKPAAGSWTGNGAKSRPCRWSSAATH